MPRSPGSSDHTGRRQLLPLGVLLLLVAIRLPVVTTPFFEDDLHQLAYLSGVESQPFSFQGSWDLFRFFDGDVAAAQERIGQGALPWRTEPTQKVAFLRPIASGLMWVDHSLFGIRSLPAHIHSLLWFIAFVLSARLLYSQLLPRRAALIALLACLLTPASLQALRWWSARNALLAVLFATWCLIFYLDWWRSGRWSRLAAALVFLLAALLSAESALAILAYPLAHALVEGRGSAAKAASRFAPLLICSAGYLMVRRALGYGVAGSALYVNPLVDPLGYVETALPRLHEALAIVFLNEVSRSTWIIVPLLLALLVLIVARLRAGGVQARLLGWLTAGSLLALSICFASRSSLRPWTMLIPQLGAHAVLGLVIAASWGKAEASQIGPEERRLTAFRRLLAAALAIACLVAPLHRHWTMAETSFHTDSAQARAAQFPPAVRRSLNDSTRLAVLLNSPYQVRTAGYLRLLHDLDVDSRLAVLTASDNPFAGASYVLERSGPKTFDLSSDAPLLRRNDLFRFDSQRPLEAGQSISGDGFRVKIREVKDNVVSSISVELDDDLDAPGIVLLRWSEGKFRLVVPPGSGEMVTWP